MHEKEIKPHFNLVYFISYELVCCSFQKLLALENTLSHMERLASTSEIEENISRNREHTRKIFLLLIIL